MAWLAFVVAAFAIVAWICRPQPARARSRAAGDVEQHLVELTTTASVGEANELAARLRRAGIVALANAAPLPREHGWRGSASEQRYRAYVAVLAAEADRARELLYAEHRAEGDATPDEIAAELDAIAAADERADGDADDSDSGDASRGPEIAEQESLDDTPFHRGLERAWRWLWRAALVMLLAAVAVAVWRALMR
jgi:hypothetical protein